MKKPSSPCLDCPDRDVECHSTCEKYKAYVKEQDKYRELVRSERDTTYFEYSCDHKLGELAKEYRRGQGKWSRRKKW